MAEDEGGKQNETSEASSDVGDDNSLWKFHVNFFTQLKEYLKDIYPKSAMELHNRIKTLIDNRNEQVLPDLKYSCPKCSRVSNYSSCILNNVENEENKTNPDGSKICGFCNGIRKLHISYLNRWLAKKNRVNNKATINVTTSPVASRIDTLKEVSIQDKPTTKDKHDNVYGEASPKTGLGISNKRKSDVTHKEATDPKLTKAGTQETNPQSVKNLTEVSQTSNHRHETFKIIMKYVCPICTSIYVYPSKLLRHMQERHNLNLTRIPANCQRLQCPFCRTLLLNKNYNEHIKTTHPEKFYENVGGVENSKNTNKCENKKRCTVKNNTVLNRGNTESTKSSDSEPNSISNDECNESETCNSHGIDNDSANATLAATSATENGKQFNNELSTGYINNDKQSTENTAIEGTQIRCSNINKEKETDSEDDCIKASNYTVKKRKERISKLFGDRNEASVSNKIKASNERQKQYQTPKDRDKKTDRRRRKRKADVVHRRRKVNFEQCQARLANKNEPPKTNNRRARDQEKEEKNNEANTAKSTPVEKLQETYTSPQVESPMNTKIQEVVLEQPFVNTVPGKADSNATNFRVRSDLNATNFKCDHCSKSFDIKSDLEKHIQTHELLKQSMNLRANKDFTCKECSCTFQTKLLLLEHAKSKHAVEYFACAECEYATCYKWNLQEHLRTHTGERPFKCNQCSSAFILHGNLKKHLRTHTGEKPYKCNQCSSAFTGKCNLKRLPRVVI